MAFSLRLPPALDHAARARSEQLGISLNGVICLALDLYLRGGDNAPPAATPALPSPPEVKPLPVAKNALKPVLKASVVPSGPPSPPGPGSSKAERRAYTDYIRASRKNSGAVTL